mmetsp:Transcript_45451/g.108683  ORF Transcript_45451/g.108683 Transcript_45451/m.108683 type:complete len:387 (+) Transcript_45451:281-1441(+)
MRASSSFWRRISAFSRARSRTPSSNGSTSGSMRDRRALTARRSWCSARRFSCASRWERSKKSRSPAISFSRCDWSRPHSASRSARVRWSRRRAVSRMRFISATLAFSALRSASSRTAAADLTPAPPTAVMPSSADVSWPLFSIMRRVSSILRRSSALRSWAAWRRAASSRRRFSSSTRRFSAAAALRSASSRCFCCCSRSRPSLRRSISCLRSWMASGRPPITSRAAPYTPWRRAARTSAVTGLMTATTSRRRRASTLSCLLMRVSSRPSWPMWRQPARWSMRTCTRRFLAARTISSSARDTSEPGMGTGKASRSVTIVPNLSFHSRRPSGRTCTRKPSPYGVSTTRSHRLSPVSMRAKLSMRTVRYTADSCCTRRSSTRCSSSGT